MKPRSTFWKIAHVIVMFIGVMNVLALLGGWGSDSYAGETEAYQTGRLFGSLFWVVMGSWAAWSFFRRNEPQPAADTRPYVFGTAPPAGAYAAPALYGHQPQHPGAPYGAAPATTAFGGAMPPHQPATAAGGYGGGPAAPPAYGTAPAAGYGGAPHAAQPYGAQHVQSAPPPAPAPNLPTQPHAAAAVPPASAPAPVQPAWAPGQNPYIPQGMAPVTPPAAAPGSAAGSTPPPRQAP